MPGPTPLPAPFDRQPFRVSDARARGVGAGRLRGGDLLRPFHGVRATTSNGLMDAVLAYSRRMTPHQYFSHWTAAELHELPLPRQPREIHVTAAAPARAPRARGVVGHTSKSCAVVRVHGLPISAPVQTWVAMSTELNHEDLVVMGDALVRRKHPLATLEQLAAAVAAHHGHRGFANLAAAFARVRARTDSVRETLLRLAIVDFGLPEPEVNFEIRDAQGRFLAFGDLVYPEFRVIAEYDGQQHRTDERQFHRDVDRLDDLAEERYRVVRFNKSHISLERLHRLRRALLAAGWRP